MDDIMDIEKMLDDGVNDDLGLDLEDNSNPIPGTELKKKVSTKDKILESKLKQTKEELAETKRSLDEMRNELKEVAGWRKRILGESDEDKSRDMLTEERKRYENDPYSFNKEILDKRVKELESKIQATETIRSLEDASKSIERDYDIDWRKNEKAIIKEISNFSLDARKADPKGVLLKACRLAGALRAKKKETDINYIEGGNYYNSLSRVKDAEKKLIKDGIRKASMESNPVLKNL